MVENVTLAIDYSTTSTGYAVFKKTDLVDFGVLKTRSLKIYKGYPFGTLRKLEDMALYIKDVIDKVNPDQIVIEEVNRGISRLSQKPLDAGHFILLQLLSEFEGNLHYIDTSAWRNYLNLKKFTPLFKKEPKACRKKLPAQHYVNNTYSMNFDVVKNKSDADICDAICIGDAFIHFVLDNHL